MDSRSAVIRRIRVSRSSLLGVTHVRPEDRRPRHRRSACRKGRHDYSEPQHIGAGIVRQVCDACSAVTIDLTGAYEAKSVVVSDNRGIISLVTKEIDED